MAKRTISLAAGVALAAGLTSFGALNGASSATAAGACSIPASKLTVTATNQSGSNSDVEAWDQFKVAYTLNGLDGMAAGSCITFTAPEQFSEIPSSTINLLSPDGQLIGTQRISDGTVTVTLTTDYAAKHSNVKVWGSYTAKIKDTIAVGATVPLNFTVNGSVTTTTNVTTTTCVDCTAMPVDHAQKWGWETATDDAVTIVSPVVPKAGTTVRITDTLVSGDQAFAGAPTAYSYTARNAWGHAVDAYDLDVKANADGSWSVTTLRDNEAVRFTIPMTFKGAGPWVDNAVVMIDGQKYQASTKVLSHTAEGAGNGTTVPDVPQKPVGEPETPKPVVKTKTYTVQVDTYSWRNSAWFGSKIASFDDDGVLKYREDGFLWMSANAKKYTGYGHTFVSFTAPVNATKAQLVAAYNKKAPLALRITTTAKLANKVAATGKVVDVWVLGNGATTKAAWGPKNNINQVFLGRR